MVGVVAINLSRRLAHLDNDRTVPITNLFDEFGDDTDEIDEAVALVCGEPGCWLTITLCAFDAEVLH